MRSLYRRFLIIGLAAVSGCQETTPPTPAPTAEPIWSRELWSVVKTLSLPDHVRVSDPSNRYLHNEKAVQLGGQLFFDPRFSANGQISCASCHQPQQQFSDGLPTAKGMQVGSRNTPSLIGAGLQTWFFWDGRKDSLWAQTLSPIEDAREHDIARTDFVRLLLSDEHYKQQYQAIFGDQSLPDINQLPKDARPSGTLEQIRAWKSIPDSERTRIDQAFANSGKSLAAYVASIPPARSRFDQYVQAVSAGESGTDILSADEIQGLRLFLDPKTQCLSCHSGSLLSNQSFHNIGTGELGRDSGRAAVIDQVRFDRFNCLGPFSDAKPEQCTHLQYMQRNRHQLIGAYKTPSLRNVGQTAPYFHDGRLNTLEEVVAHYIDSPELKAGRADIQAIELSAEEQRQLVAFLKALNVVSRP